MSILKVIVYFKWVNCLGYKSYLNETINLKNVLVVNNASILVCQLCQGTTEAYDVDHGRDWMWGTGNSGLYLPKFCKSSTSRIKFFSFFSKSKLQFSK